IFDEIGDSSIGIIEHRFPAALAAAVRYGRFNVGWVTFRNDTAGRRCLALWRDQCLDWCYDRLEAGRFAEPKYLDEWPSQFAELRVIEHRGANVAPWNLDTFEIARAKGGVQVGGQPLVFYHAHGFEPAGPSRPRALNIQKYGVDERPVLLDAIFE